MLLKHLLSFVFKTDKDLRIQPLQGGDQSIAWPNFIPATKEGIDLYLKHNVVKDGYRGNINVTKPKSIGKMKDNTSIFRSYLNKEKFYASQAPLVLVDARNDLCVPPSGPKPKVPRRSKASNH
jgi:hypothetical protein